MRTVAIVLVLVVGLAGLAGLAFAGEPPAEKSFEVKDYTCKVCYEPIPTDKVACETLVSDTLEGVQQMVMASAEAQEKVDKVTVDCSFPVRTEKGYTGYKATITMKK